MDSDTLVETLEQEVKGLTSYLAEDDYINAIADAERETGFSLPTTDAFQIRWLKERTKRHLFFYLMSESAHKFKVDQINLQHRFEHYNKIIEKMDKAFEEALESNPEKFAGADAWDLFGSKVDAGFAYDNQTGIDLTYTDKNLINVSPSDTD